jgi:uncharacterized paraquat-inducible protein A
MALVKCKSCGGEVSSKAYSCPHCGHPIRKSPGARLAQGCGGIVMMAVGLVILFVMAAAVGLFK